MNYKVNTLSNGIRVLTVPMTSLESVTVTVWVKTGSRNEEKRTSGISHFLEHMVFKGSKKRPTARQISELVDSFGGEMNAGTSKDWTNFYIKSRTANVDIAMDVLSNMVLNPILDETEIEREKGTIVQEMAMYEDAPMRKIHDVFEELVFQGNPLGWDTIGTEKSLKNTKKNDFLRYRESYYYPENILVTVAGGVTEKEALVLSKKYFEKFSPKSKSKINIADFKKDQTQPQIKLKNKKNDQANLIIGFLGDGRDYKNRYVQSVLSGILLGGMSSRLFLEIRERRGLVYAILSAGDRFQEVGYFGAYAGVDPKKAEETIKIILEQCYGLRDKKYPISKKELEKTKEYIKGHVALSGFFGEQELFLSKVLTPEDVYKKIDEVTIEDVYNEAKRLFVPSHLNLAVIGPYNNEDKFKKLLK